MKAIPKVLLALLMLLTLASCERMHGWQRAEDGLLVDVGVPTDWEFQGSGIASATSEGDPWDAYRLPEVEQPDAGVVRVPVGFEQMPPDSESAKEFSSCDVSRHRGRMCQVIVDA